MKRFFLVLLTLLFIGFTFAVQPARKPFIQLTVDGKPIKSGEVLTVVTGQKLTVGAEMEGGRRDFCKFPDIYADIAGTAQILSRGKDGLIYQLSGVKSEWKLLDEIVLFTGDKFVKVIPGAKKSIAEITLSDTPFSQSFLKVNINAKWQFSQSDKTNQEENIAEAIVYFKVSGTSDEWFSTRNVKASGVKNEQVQEKLNAVQAKCDSIESSIYKLKFPAVQQSIKSLQTDVSEVKLAIEEVKKSNTAYLTKIVFIGLPTDNTINNLSTFAMIKTNWGSLETLVQSLKELAGKLPAQATKESKDELVKLIGNYVDWQYKLPENTFKILSQYIPDFNPGDIQIPGNIHFIAEEKTITNYSKTFSDFNAFLDKRIELIPMEIQKINATQTKLQAVRLFDGMLRSYFSSIGWAEWKNTRE
ncbi:MAG: hypothetical protein JZU47_06910 [Prolixibacteraceae bacterium]|nr:hypothetical protein [Prolixibacteraceae bacterium]